jgi:fibronectin type 3 domain-containing protein
MLNASASTSGFGFAVGEPLFDGVEGTYAWQTTLGSHHVDVDGDGRRDLVVTTRGAISWRPGTDGGFGPVQTLLDPAEPITAVEMADLDGSGTLDVVTYHESYSDPRHLNVYVNDAGTMRAPLQVESGQLRHLAVIDADADGNLDVIAVRFNRDTYSDVFGVFRNALSTTGTFEPWQALNGLGGSGMGLLVADVDQDGVQDAVVSTVSSTLWAQGGSTSLLSLEDLAPAQLGTSVVLVRDLDGNGWPDLVHSGQGMTWTPQLSAGTWGERRSIPLSTPTGQFAAGDLDGDGDHDLLWTRVDGYDTPVQWVWSVNDGGTFDETRVIARTQGNSVAVSPLSDLDGDGDLDVLATVSEGTIRVLPIENVDTPPRPPVRLRSQSADATVYLSWAPSGDWDLQAYRIYRGTSPVPTTVLTSIPSTQHVFADEGVDNGTTYYYRVSAVDAAGTEGPSASVAATPAVPVTRVEPAAGLPGTTVRVYGSGFPTDPAASTVTFGGTAATVRAATPTVLTVDVPSGPVGPVEIVVDTKNGRDAAPDLFTVQVDAFRGEFAAGTGLAGNERRVRRLWTGDVDGDGDDDLIGFRSGSWYGASLTVVWYENTDAAGTLAAGRELFPISDAGAAVADVDGDGDPDVVSWVEPGYGDDLTAPQSLVVWENDGTGRYLDPHLIAESTHSIYNPAVEVADVDGDGLLDVLTVGAEKGLAWYRQVGPGRFERAVIDAGVDPGQVAVTDVDGDGDLDVVAAEAYPRQTYVYANQLNENAGFSLLQTVGEDNVSFYSSQSFAVGDLDGDGWPDLYHQASPEPLWYRNESGRFGASRAVGDGALEWKRSDHVRVGDVEADGRSDVMVVLSEGDYTQTTDRIVWLTLNAAGAWTPLVEMASTTNLESWQRADLDGDGDLDLYVTRQDGSIAMFESDDFAPPAPERVQLAGRDGAAVVQWALPPAIDLDATRVYRQADGGSESLVAEVPVPATQWTDDAVANGTSYRYRLTVVDRAGQESAFTPARTVVPAVPVTALAPESGMPGTRVFIYGSGFDPTPAANVVTVGGVPAEVVAASPAVLTAILRSGVVGPADVQVDAKGGSVHLPAGVTVVGPESHGEFEPQGSTTLPAGDNPHSVRTADLDGDGDLDVLTARVANEYLYSDYEYVWIEYAEDASAEPTIHPIAVEQGGAGVPLVVDLDRDGDLDLISVHDGRQLVWYANDGTGQFGSRSTLVDSVHTQWSHVRTGDLNGDGALDLLAVNADGRVSWFADEGVRSFGAAQPLDPRTDEVRDVETGDLDGDGDLDVVVARMTAPRIVHYENRLSDDGTWAASSPDPTGIERPIDVRIADLNDDGRLDVLVSASVDLFWLENRADGFERHDLLQVLRPQHVQIADVDGDGASDILFQWHDGGRWPPVSDQRDLEFPVSWLRNLGGGQFSDRRPVARVRGPAGIALGDLDGNGSLDVVRRGVGNVQWWSNANRLPAAPPLLGGTAGPQSAILEWGPSASWDVTGYRLYRGTAPNPTTEIYAGDANALDYADTGLVDGTAYHYRVVAVDTEGAVSAAASTIVVPGDPSLAVSRVAPTHGAPGSTVRLFGSGFGDAPIVTIGGDDAPVIDVTTSRLVVTVPDGISGPVRIRVTRDDQVVNVAERYTRLRPGAEAEPFGSAVPLPISDSVTFRFGAAQPAFMDEPVGSETSPETGPDFPDLLTGYRNGESFYLGWLGNRLEDRWEMDGPHEIAPASDGLRVPQLADVDGDGDTDVVVANYDDEGIDWYENQGAGVFVQREIARAVPSPGAPLTADLDADGDVDVVAATGSFGEDLVWYENYDGTGRFSPIQISARNVSQVPAIDDADGDGDADLLVVYYDHTSEWLLNDGTGQFPDRESTPVSGANATVHAEDLDGDGLPDLLQVVYSYNTDAQLQWARNRGASASPRFANWVTLHDLADGVDWLHRRFNGFALADLDADADIDVVAVTTSPNTGRDDRLVWLENVGGGTFAPDAHEIGTGRNLWNPVVTDLDAEGWLDVLIHSYDGFNPSLFAYSRASTVLPVELSAFSGTIEDGGVRLDWATASETGNAGFEIQRQNARTGAFERVGFQKGAGTTTAARTYRFTDRAVPFTADSLVYRLQQVDLDGTTSLSDPVTVRRVGPEALRLHGTFPNPTHTAATLRYELPAAADVQIRVYDVLGRVVATVENERQTAGRKELRLDTSRWASGTYFVRLVTNTGTQTTRLTVVR